MNREIKFRAYRKLINEMIYSDDEDNQGWLNTFFVEVEEVGGYEVMRSFLLTDKNGKDVYISDVVTAAMPYEGGFLPIMGIVEFDDNLLCYGLRNDAGFTPFYCIALYSVEVKGNIYQNPELIKTA